MSEQPHRPDPSARPATPTWDDAYAGSPPWDIGRPQPALRALADAGVLRGRLLDAGCGTGEHALMAAGLGLAALGVDMAPRAIALAERKARERGLAARFLVHDALALGDLGESFDTVLDSGLFHVFEDAERPRYAAGLRAVLTPGGVLHLLCFSDRQPGTMGPRRIGEAAIRDTFADGFRVEAVDPAIMQTNRMGEIRAWLARIVRI
jgi:cyclopropane fatty-acyl-phospholipid synthase-like methyltransferase